MTDPGERNWADPGPSGSEPRGCGSLILILVGVLLLLPGLCGLAGLVETLSTGHFTAGVAGFVFMTFLVAAIGAVLIRLGTRSGR